MQNIIYEPSANDQEDKKLSLSIKLKAIYSLIKNRWSRRRALGLIALISATILTLQLLGISLNNFYNYIEPLTTKIDQLSDNANWITWVALLALVSYLTYLLKPLGKRCIGYFRECYVEYEKLVKSFVINPTEEKPIGFVTDTPEEEKLDIGWRNYCSTIVSTLEATDLSKDCFAIGISGGWGSGKTTFLKELQAQLKENPSYMLIEYNPWNTGNKSDIVENFFKTFSSLVGHRSSLYPHLQRYARALSDVGGINWEALTNIFIPEKTLDELKEQINQSVLNSRKRYVFFIDDLDRLDKEEIFEVLKLIRASANFKNTIFIVAYDPDYIENMLKELGVTEPLIYLQKVFNLELSLPSFEGYRIQQLLHQEVSKFMQDQAALEHLKDQVLTRYNNQYLLPTIIKSFRDAKRFANLFRINYGYLNTSGELNNIDIRDLFWLEIIHYAKPELYQILLFSRYELLSVKDNLYRLKGSETRVLFGNAIEWILSRLFIQTDTPRSSRSIQHIENYDRYFSLRTLKGHISIQAIDSFLASAPNRDLINQQIDNWLNLTLQTSHTSLVRNIELYDIAHKHDEEQKAFMLFVAELIAKIAANISLFTELTQIIKRKLTKKNFKDPSKLENFTYELFRDYSTKVWSNEQSLILMKELYPSNFFLTEEGEMDYRRPLLLDNNRITELLDICSIAHIQRLPSDELCIANVVNTETQLFSVLSSFCKEIIYEDDELFQKKNLALNGIIKYFSANKASNDFQQFRKALFYVDDYDLNNEGGIILNRITKVFGSLGSYKSFIEACFDLDEETFEKHIQYLDGLDRSSTYC